MRRKLFLTYLLFISFTTAQDLFEIEPLLISDDFRLAAMGDLDLVIEDLTNELNLYDFGGSPCAIIADDSGKSSVCLKSRFGFDKKLEIGNYTEWTGSSMSIGGNYKHNARWAVGGTIFGQKRDFAFDSWTEMYRERYDLKNIYDTLTFASSVSKFFNVGIRGAYHRDMAKTIQYLNNWEHSGDTWTGEPSFSITSADGQWNAGLGYIYAELDPHTYDVKTRELKIPLVFHHGNLSLGIKITHKLACDSDGDRSSKETFGNLRGLYKILFSNRSIILGLLINRDMRYEYWHYGGPFYNMFMNFAIGIALTDNDFGVIGMQIHQKIYSHDAPAYPEETILSLGAELNHFELFLIRLGFNYHSWNPGWSYSDRVTTTFGAGAYLMDKKIALDFAYNFRMESIEWDTRIYYDMQHVFGLSGHIVF